MVRSFAWKNDATSKTIIHSESAPPHHNSYVRPCFYLTLNLLVCCRYSTLPRGSALDTLPQVAHPQPPFCLHPQDLEVLSHATFYDGVLWCTLNHHFVTIPKIWKS